MRKPGNRTEPEQEFYKPVFTLILSNLNSIFQNRKERTGTEPNNLSTCEP